MAGDRGMVCERDQMSISERSPGDPCDRSIPRSKRSVSRDRRRHSCDELDRESVPGLDPLDREKSLEKSLGYNASDPCLLSSIGPPGGHGGRHCPDSLSNEHISQNGDGGEIASVDSGLPCQSLESSNSVVRIRG